MQNNNRYQADAAYGVISGKSQANSATQALTGLGGFPFTIAADAAVIPMIYMPLWNDIRKVYGHVPVDSNALMGIIGNILPEVLADLVMDKILGNVPILGVYFNAVCAKAMTWRHGILFAFLSSRGSDIPSGSVRKAMELIRVAFPQREMFKFQTPDKETFIRLVTSAEGLSVPELNSRIDKALGILGEKH